MAEWMDDIEKYRRGELSPKEMHELEKRALSDPFLADALEGLDSVNADQLSNDLDELNRSIHKKKRVTFTPLRIAAGIVLLISAGLYVFWPSNEQKQIVQTPIVADSIPQTKPEEKPKEQLTLTDDGKEAPEDTKQEEINQEETEKTAKQKATRTDTRTTAASTKQTDTTKTIIPNEELTRDTQVAPLLAKETTPSISTKSTKTISGTVTVAEDGLPLPGVTIKVKDLPVGTTTDINGHYSLTVPDSTSIVFSFVGMQTSEITTADKSTIDVKMNEDVAQLSEVVITRSALARPVSEEPIVILAEPVGGIKAYDKYMVDNLRYPQQALDNNVKGRVVVEFNVGVDGALNNFVVMRGLGHGCDDEVIRLVKEGPTWRPTTEDNKPVESSVRVRMRFDPTKAKRKR